MKHHPPTQRSFLALPFELGGQGSLGILTAGLGLYGQIKGYKEVITKSKVAGCHGYSCGF